MKQVQKQEQNKVNNHFKNIKAALTNSHQPITKEPKP